ncbi:hypothetical protein DMH04_51295 [Kibdelosporangium aridum]|uniref:Uncharacterized protein n=1 Tax=Kibdelosporangium aridum TaxID=2030 RepID=A0A428YA59_KIBAR|nr:hypothetical protein [Kibdelosporangium aridum]RSM64475.1 hypothetical protein DMH04_51295 [Kibdelosporangium aridum]
MRRIIALVLSVLAAGTVAVAAATPAAAATCGSYLHLHKAPPSGTVLFGNGNQIGTESFTGSTLRINRFSFYNHVAHFGDNIKPGSKATFIYSNTANGDVRTHQAGASSNGVVRDDNRDALNRVNVNNLLYPGTWNVIALWVGDCGDQTENEEFLGYVQVT